MLLMRLNAAMKYAAGVKIGDFQQARRLLPHDTQAGRPRSHGTRFHGSVPKGHDVYNLRLTL